MMETELIEKEKYDHNVNNLNDSMKTIQEDEEEYNLNKTMDKNQLNSPQTENLLNTDDYDIKLKDSDDIDDLETEDNEVLVEPKEMITYGIKEIVLKPSIKIETNVEKVDREEIDLTNCIKVSNYFLEKLEHMMDLSHSISYKTRNTKDFKLYTL